MLIFEFTYYFAKKKTTVANHVVVSNNVDAQRSPVNKAYR